MPNPKVSTRPPDHWEPAGRGDAVKADFCREESSAGSGRDKRRDSARAVHGWSQQNAGAPSSRLATSWAFTGLTDTAPDSQTSDYRANKYKEGPELNSIPFQQSHLSLGLILC